MSEYYTVTGNPAANSAGSSSLIRSEFSLIDAGFAKLPTLSGNANELVVVNAGATALTTATAASLSLVTLTGSQTLDNKTLGTGTVLGTPNSGTLTNCTGLPISTGVAGLGTGVATFLATPSSANLAAAMTDETGSGALVFATSPTLVTPALGTPASGNLTSCTADGTNSVGFKHIPQITKVADGAPTTGADLTYAGKHIYHTSTAGTFTIPSNAAIAYPIGTAITFINGNGAGALTIAITSDTMYLAGAGTTGSRTLSANGIATAIKVALTTWIISGTNLA